MEECKPSSDAEETLVENGSASPPEDKIRGTFDSQNKGATNISEEIPILEGSVLPEYENFVPDSESKKNEDESKEKEEDEEKKHIEVNSVEKETDHEEAKEVVQDCGDKGNEDESDKKEVDDEKKHTEEKKHIEVNSVEKETDPEEAKEVVQDRGDKGNEDESDKKEVDDEKKHTEETAVAKETDNEESKEGEKIEASDTMEEENKIEETNEENMIEATGAVSKENDLAKDDKETRDTNVSTEDVKMVDEEGGKGEEGETTDMVKPNDIKELREDKMTDVASTVKSEDVKVADVEGDKVMPLEDVKMVETPAGESEEGIEEKGVEQEPQGGENDMDRGKNGSIEKEDEDKKVVGFKRKRSQVQKTKSKGGDSVEKAKELLNSPITSSMERPVRERKTVERLVEVIEKERSREFQVEKGRGTPLKDIPSVAHKLARKKPADIKLIHQTLFGRRGKAVNFKNHILQFSGFVWHESDEKQRAKMKEKLDKYVKDTLLDLCDLFDLPASKANSRKEELVEKLLDFLVAPHPNTEQSTKSRKRKRASKGNLSKGTEDNHSKRSRKKQIRDEASLSEEDKSAPETDDEDDVNTSSPHKGKAVEHSESEDEEDATHEVSEEDVPEKEVIGKDNKDKKKVPRQRDSVKEKARSSSKQELAPVTTKSSKASSSKLAKPDDDDNGDVSEKVSSRKKKRTDSPKEKTIRSTKKEKDTGKKVGKDKAKQETQQPGKEELRKKICEILKEVDFNTATFTDILKRLATHYKTDLTLRKASIKFMIQEELTKLAEAEEDEDDDEEEEPNAEKVQVKKQKVT